MLRSTKNQQNFSKYKKFSLLTKFLAAG